MGWIAGLLLGAVLGAVGAAAFVADRVRALSAVEFTLHAPPVPASVVHAVRIAEGAFYADLTAPRRMAEAAQDVAAFLHPPLVYRLNLSVGPYRLKGATLAETIPWALNEGYLHLGGAPPEDFHWLYVYLAEQPGLADWGAAARLEWLRRDHPGLRGMGWDEIAADPALVAKVYSGYMGAGGAWEAWRADLTPGAVARARMGLS
ncbi:hypothetical protein JQC91_13425 [Jannaschia sp. Os4]|uniref:hypothetical protein n=1 Tax=Jannaschia sp. Os4 TaxID=2807617 RepID=UPI00193AAC17|nr:hypothetical protein [Jannaschia sp. Os4]MBM2577304.1 hypothetical protein [Jannaschia sp. Os4]